MRLVYIYHSGFAVEAEGFSMIIDYYKDTSPEYGKGLVYDYFLKSAKPLYVLSSHVHPDHFNPEVLEWRNQKPDIRYIFSKDILGRRGVAAADACFLAKGEAFSDECLSVRAFGSTDIGISFLIEAEGRKIFHAGDLNNWHWKDESTPEEVRESEVAFLSELDDISRFVDAVDVAMFPVDPNMGTDYMLGAQQFVGCIQTRLFVPMHFGENYEKGMAFKAYAEQSGARFFAFRQRGAAIEI